MRVTVSLVLGLVAEGMSMEREDIRQSIKYAANLTNKHIPRFPKDDAWITEAINKVCAEVDTSLDPAIAAMQWASLRKVEW